MKICYTERMNVRDVWKHGALIDLWTLVHILSGALLGVAASWIGFSFLTSLILAFLLLIAWEAYEWLLGILESPANVASDLVFGTLGFLAMTHFVHDGPPGIAEAGALILVLVALAGWGFRDLFVHGYR